MKFKLPNDIASPQDLASLTREIHDYASWYAHESIKKRVAIKHTSTPPPLSNGGKQLIREIETSPGGMSRQNLDSLLRMLEDYAANVSTVIITLAAPAPASLKSTLVGWCRENISPNVFVNFQINSTLLGGMVVRHGSRVFDWSFRRKLLGASSSFPEILRHV